MFLLSSQSHDVHKFDTYFGCIFLTCYLGGKKADQRQDQNVKPLFDTREHPLR